MVENVFILFFWIIVFCSLFGAMAYLADWIEREGR